MRATAASLDYNITSTGVPTQAQIPPMAETTKQLGPAVARYTHRPTIASKQPGICRVSKHDGHWVYQAYRYAQSRNILVTQGTALPTATSLQMLLEVKPGPAPYLTNGNVKWQKQQKKGHYQTTSPSTLRII